MLSATDGPAHQFQSERFCNEQRPSRREIVSSPQISLQGTIDGRRCGPRVETMTSMFRKAILAVGLALTAGVPVLYAQQPTTPPVPEDALSPRELIAWNSLQIPRPAQQQLPAIQAQPHEAIQDSVQSSQHIISSEPQREAVAPRNPAQTMDSRTRAR